MSNHRLIIVTGANRGIGNAIAKRLLSKTDLSLKLFATSRSGQNLDLDSHSTCNQHEIHYAPLDIESPESITAFADFVRKQHGRVDVLINNAGVNLDLPQYSLENARRTLDVNWRGTLHMCNTFLPHLAPAGRIVNLASVASSLQPYSPHIQARFRNASTLEDLEILAQEFESSVRSATEEQAGFASPGRSYSLSKVLVRALTNILAAQNPEFLINSCCPGWVASEMGNSISGRGRSAPKSLWEGSEIPVRLAVEEDFGGGSGGYWANESVRGRGRGVLQEW